MPRVGLVVGGAFWGWVVCLACARWQRRLWGVVVEREGWMTVEAWKCCVSSRSLDRVVAILETLIGRRLDFFAMVFLLLLVKVVEDGMICE